MDLEYDADGSVALAAFSSRVRATFVDLALCTLTSTIIVKVAFSSVTATMDKVGVQLVGVAVFTAIFAIYEVALVGLRSRTLGNEVSKTVVVHADDLSPASLTQAVIRFAVGPLVFCGGAALIWSSPMWVLAVLGYLCADLGVGLASASGQTIHDRLARTVVVLTAE
jgi:uncharacterized RDD family membrane protein YckC